VGNRFKRNIISLKMIIHYEERDKMKFISSRTYAVQVSGQQ
jgi:hypothetical protein